MEIEVGDVVIVDGDMAEHFDPYWEMIHPGYVKCRVTYNFNDYYTVDILENVHHFNEPYHILPEHVVENKSNAPEICEKHETQLLHHDKYQFYFCPFCGIRREEKVKNHPATRKIQGPIEKFWSPFEIPEGGRVGNETFPNIFSIAAVIPFHGLVMEIGGGVLIVVHGDNTLNHQNTFWQNLLLALFCQSIYGTIELTTGIPLLSYTFL